MALLSLDTAARALSFVSADDRDTWIRMGMALYSEFGDGAFEIWDQWSASGSGYSKNDAKTAWKSFRRATKVSIGSLLYLAKERGFRFLDSEARPDPNQLAAEKAEREAKAAKREENRIRAAKAAAKRASIQWRMADQNGSSAYLERKQIRGESCRYLKDGSIIIPISNPETGLMGKQQISPDGTKRYSGRMDKSGGVVRLGEKPTSTEIIYICEGYATGGSIRAALGYAATVYVCFDTNGLVSAAPVLRRIYPDNLFIFCADDDYLEKDIGVKKANEASAMAGNSVVFVPKFTASRRLDKKDESLPYLTDCNDLHCAESIDELSRQINTLRDQVMRGEVSPGPPIEEHRSDDLPLPGPLGENMPAPEGTLHIPTADELIAHFSLIYPTTDVWDALRRQRIKKSAFEAWVGKEAARAWMQDPRRRNMLRDSLPSLIGGRAVEGGPGSGKLGEMLDNLTLLRGTETVWDGVGNQVMSLGAVRADYTPELASKWQEHSRRKTVEAKNLVFDPTQTADPVSHVNMFLGWPLKPKRNDDLVQPIIALLESLCSAEDQVKECVVWILQWLAFPLQHPGAKMQTALLMFGEKQGTGKSLFFQDIIKPIYGEYGVVASQHQLDSQFTAWRSRKLFALFEEVLSRDDKYSHNGTLKYMVTGNEMSINQKNLPERYERNHMNTAFLSNEPQPIPIELEDRRFMVIEARAKQSDEFYRAVKESIQAGGIEAFYYFLLHFPLDDFHEHTKPIMTLAKERVIEFGLNGWMSFHRHWKDGYLDAPYCSCLTEDLYIIYKRWCDKNGEKPLTSTKFNGLIASREVKVRKEVSVGNKLKMYRTVYLVDGKVEGDLDKQVNEFRNQADVRASGTL